jgi:hypothetical protein
MGAKYAEVKHEDRKLIQEFHPKGPTHDTSSNECREGPLDGIVFFTPDNGFQSSEMVLHTWAWQRNSCSLDATLTVAIQIILKLPNFAFWAERGATLEFQALFNHARSWGSWDWEEWKTGPMTKARNAVREGFKLRIPEVRISSASTIDDTLMDLIPDVLRRIKLNVVWQCNRPNCMARHLSHTNNIKNSPNWTSAPSTLKFKGQLQSDNDMQSLYDSLVPKPTSHTDICL